MGQNRNDSHSQVEAKRTGAKRRQCPSCKRRNALSSKTEVWEERVEDGEHFEERIGSVRTCRWCGHEVEIRHCQKIERAKA